MSTVRGQLVGDAARLERPAERVARARRVAGMAWRAMVANDPLGDIDVAADSGAGYFFEDTRLLSEWRLLSDGRPLEFFSSESVDAFATRYRLLPAGGPDGRLPLVVYRHEVLEVALAQQYLVINQGDEPVRFMMEVVLDSDFADAFELRQTPRSREVAHSTLPDGMRFDYARDGFRRSVTVRATEGAEIDGRTIRFDVRVAPHAQWHGEVAAYPTDLSAGEVDAVAIRTVRDRRRRELDGWRGRLPKLQAEWKQLERVYDRSIRDLHTLAAPRSDGRGFTFGAGAPQLMALFGRDMLWASLALLGFDDAPAAASLRTLAALQGQASIDRYDEEPGRIHHELRIGEFAVDGTRADSPYYGSSDATPLFLILLDEHRCFAGSDELARELEAPARAALEWIDRFGDRDGDGYVEYERRNTKDGLENQCWKDSDDSIRFRDGSLARTPLAVCEIQGYVYDAKRRCARLARDVWGDPDLADRLTREAVLLRERFNRDYWMADRGFFALALDADKRQVDSITSNAGHLLFSGIADDAKAKLVAHRLLDEAMFSGYGIRTMAVGEAAYDPVSYHNGSIWPHDNAIIACGLAQYGFTEQAHRVADAIFDASGCYGYRMPEVFAGYDREQTGYAVEYPDAQIPLAMACSATFLLLRTVFSLQPGWTGMISCTDSPLGALHLHHPAHHHTAAHAG
jgi:glycogen debranching enzyme